MVSNYLSNYCAYYLSRYSVSKKKFENILKKKIKKDFFYKKINKIEYDKLSQEIKIVLKKYDKLGIFNEEELIKLKISYFIKKGFSKKKIISYLEKEYFEREIVKKETNFINCDMEFDTKQIEKFVSKQNSSKFGNIEKISKQNFDKILKKLLREGFKYSDCYNYLKKDKI